MKIQRIGTIIHGAIGDCYEQLCAVKKIREKNRNDRWIGFFAVKERFAAMRHYNLDMLDEVYLAEDMTKVDIDYFYQYQVYDGELQQDIITHLPGEIKAKFDLKVNRKPWHAIRGHNFNRSGLELELSDVGKGYLPFCMEKNRVNPGFFNRSGLTVGYLWRHRCRDAGAVRGYFQRPLDWMIRSKSELFSRLIDEYDAHILIGGMRKNSTIVSSIPEEMLNLGGFVKGEYFGKFYNQGLNLPEEKCTYLQGIGFAAEVEIMSRCDLLLMMPSGFSEVLWMKRKTPVLLMDPAPVYMAKIWYNRMPLFDNFSPAYAYYNTFLKHSADNVMKFLKKRKLMKKRESI